MSSKYTEYKELNLASLSEDILKKWKENNIFEQSISSRDANKPFVFFEGPPSANGLPGIHHVMGRAIKDIFCRYKTLKGFRVNRKAGWDTHGLPVELSVEKELGITKEDIGRKISVADYNKACRETVMRYTDVWSDLTEKMGYWVDMTDPYVTYDSKYMESVWWLLKQIYDKDLIYKGYTIQPYSPKAGTGLSSHEINQPGCYKDVKDTTIVAQFKIKDTSIKELENAYFLAWTTTPWTLPSNTALCVGAKIDYILVNTFNQYTFEPMRVVLAKALVGKQFSGKYFEVANNLELSHYEKGAKKIPYIIEEDFKGADLLGITYNQLLPYTLPDENPEKAFQVIAGDFVTTEDGTGIVHIAPTFGADDMLVAQQAGVPPMLVKDEKGNLVPLVDLQGRFRPEMGNLAGMYVKNEYYKDDEVPEKSVDVLLAIQLKEENKAFNVAKYEHSYPHCWRTDKPILYYPLDSWFIKVTAIKDQMSDLNDTINWKPKSTGTGRFGNWLKNANDWNLSRSRYWGIPIPIWRNEESGEVICIGSIEELQKECEKSVQARLMPQNPISDFVVGDMSNENYLLVDLHKNYVDEIILVSDSGKPMKREADLIDVWFDSGSMPSAQKHFPFENADGEGMVADFIAEGVDQTRGWFYTLHAISTMIFGRVAYKNVVSNGLVLDKKGQKMSKRLGNGVDPFITLAKYGPDATRWYMITNAQPWDNLKFDLEGITETQRKFFRALHSTYSFFALYANIDGFSFKEREIALQNRPEIDQWIISKLNSLIKDVDEAYNTYEPTKAGRLIQDFVTDQLSNWYVRLCRRRFWKGDYSSDKIAAYQTLYQCLETIAVLASPIAPFFTDRLFTDLNKVSEKNNEASIHLTKFPIATENAINLPLEKRMEYAQKISSLLLSLRKKENIKVRQPLQKIMIPILDADFQEQVEGVKDLILSEVNVKEIAFLTDTSGVLVKKIKPNFRTIGPKYGKQMKAIAGIVAQFDQEKISEIEKNNGCSFLIGENKIELELTDFEIASEDIPGWLVANDGLLTVALDITISKKLQEEGIAREFVNRIQNIRKDAGLDVVDRIKVQIKSNEKFDSAINNNLIYICSETLADSLETIPKIQGKIVEVEIEEGIKTDISIEKLN